LKLHYIKLNLLHFGGC